MNNVCGLIVFPDDWENTYTIGSENTSTASFVTVSNWTSIEAAGAVFLPCDGYRNGTSAADCTTFGYYWSSNSGSALLFYSAQLSTSSTHNNYSGLSVRLVHNVE